MAFTEGFVSELVGRRATIDDLPIGRVTDFVVNKPDDVFPRIDGIIVKTAQGKRHVPIDHVREIDDHGTVVLAIAPKDPAPPDDETLYLVADLLDKQIVDVDGRKVVRINDIEIANTAGRLRVIAADVGISGLLRRLGVRIGKRITSAAYRAAHRALIPWSSVAPITDKNPWNVRLAVQESKLSRLHPSELAEVISDLSKREALAIVHQLDDETAADAFEHLDRDLQKTLIEDIGTERAADIIEEMDSDDAADLIADLPEEDRSKLLGEMSTSAAHELRELAKYPDDTAGGLMTTDLVWIYPHRTAEATISKIRELGPGSEFIYYLYVVDRRDHLLGVLSLRALLLAPPDAFIEAILEGDVVTVAPETPAVEAAATIAKYDLLAVPVVAESGKLLGIVTVDDAIDAIMPADVARHLPRFTHHHKTHAAAPEPS
ncbi:MAG: magnesium transporter MgtE N-terminal domain-containing protein [Candidatus Tyrphobacter sp.]